MTTAPPAPIDPWDQLRAHLATSPVMATTPEEMRGRYARSEELYVEVIKAHYPTLYQDCLDAAEESGDTSGSWVALEARKRVEPRILLNQARCTLCEQTIISIDRHDFRACSFGALYVDGGTSYVRRAFTDALAYEELTVYEPLGQVRDRLDALAAEGTQSGSAVPQD